MKSSNNKELPSEILKQIISYFPSPKWFRLCKLLHTLSTHIISPLEYRLGQGGALGWAVLHNKKQAIAFLLQDPRVDPSAFNNIALQLACYHGHKDIVQLLLEDPRVNPGVPNNKPLNMATYQGHLEIVQLLLEGKYRLHILLKILSQH
jgi:hypothetical protein